MSLRYSWLAATAILLSFPAQMPAQIDHGDGVVTLSQNGFLFHVITAKSFSCYLNTEKKVWDSDEKKWDLNGVFDQISLTQINPYYFSGFISSVKISIDGDRATEKYYPVQYDVGRFGQNSIQHYIVKNEKRIEYVFSFQRYGTGSLLKLRDGKLIGSGECTFKNLPFVDPRPNK